MPNHGISALHGIDAMCDPNHKQHSKFGRLFPDLDPLVTDDAILAKLGEKGGPMDGGTDDDLSTSIPLGFVFFGQFVDHDITFDPTSRLGRMNDPLAIRNFRTPNLDLDCIYGGGKEASPHLYKRTGGSLLTGKDGTGLLTQPLVYRNGDLVRSSEGVAIIGDPRNDENRIISQLQLAMINYHNKVMEMMQSGDYDGFLLTDAHGETESYVEAAHRIARWHYQYVIIKEFLPIMVGANLVEEILAMPVENRVYKVHEDPMYPNRKMPFMPIEFAAAAYRFGHSIVTQKLKTRPTQTNTMTLFGRELGMGFEQVASQSDIVDWTMFFDINGAGTAQRAAKLDAKLASILLELPGPVVATGEKSLATRNLLRGNSFLLPSGEAVADALGIVNPADRDPVRDFINNVQDKDGNPIDLSGGTPLWFYLLAEAETIGKKGGESGTANMPGEGLGPVGGRLVADVLIGLIQHDPTSFLNAAVPFRPS